MNHQIPSPERLALVLDLINTSLPKLGLCACISSRITTVIQVVRNHSITDINEPLADMHSLVFETNHMTTGR